MQVSNHQIIKPREKRILSGLFFALAILLGGHATLAAPTAPNPEAGKRACKPDVLRLCKSQIFSGKAAVQACLRENQADLSPECGGFLKQAAEFRAAMRQTCGADIQQHCKSHIGKQEAMRACIKEHRTQFSADCQSFLKASQL